MEYVQNHRIVYHEKFAPIVPSGELLFLIGILKTKGWQLQHANIFVAFLNEKIYGELYLKWIFKTYRLLKCL